MTIANLEKKIFIKRIIVIASILFTVLYCIYETKELGHLSEVFFIRLEDPVDEETAEDILQQNNDSVDPYSMSFWEVQKSGWDSALTAMANVSKVIVKGNIDLVNGHVLTPGIVYVQGQSDLYSWMAVRKKEKISAAETARSLGNRYGVEGTAVNYALLSELSGLLWIVCAVYAGVSVCRCVSERTSKGGPVQVLTNAAVLLGVVLFLIWIVRFPAEYIPTKWSDFVFWGQLSADKKKEAEILLASGWIGRGGECLRIFLSNSLGMILLLVLTGRARVLWKINQYKRSGYGERTYGDSKDCGAEEIL